MHAKLRLHEPNQTLFVIVLMTDKVRKIDVVLNNTHQPLFGDLIPDPGAATTELVRLDLYRVEIIKHGTYEGFEPVLQKLGVVSPFVVIDMLR